MTVNFMTGRWEGRNILLCWGPLIAYRVDNSGDVESSFRASEMRPGIQKKLYSFFAGMTTISQGSEISQ